MPGHPCQSFACAIQKCLAQHNYDLEKCEHVVMMLVNECSKMNRLDGPCEGFKDQIMLNMKEKFE